jgi:hypothetical protein
LELLETRIISGHPKTNKVFPLSPEKHFLDGIRERDRLINPCLEISDFRFLREKNPPKIDKVFIDW